jgi:hypothetical protein
MNQETYDRYNDADLKEFKQLILEKIENAQRHLHLIESAFKIKSFKFFGSSEELRTTLYKCSLPCSSVILSSSFILSFIYN